MKKKKGGKQLSLTSFFKKTSTSKPSKKTPKKPKSKKRTFEDTKNQKEKTNFNGISIEENDYESISTPKKPSKKRKLNLKSPNKTTNSQINIFQKFSKTQNDEQNSPKKKEYKTRRSQKAVKKIDEEYEDDEIQFDEESEEEDNDDDPDFNESNLSDNNDDDEEYIGEIEEIEEEEYEDEIEMKPKKRKTRSQKKRKKKNKEEREKIKGKEKDKIISIKKFNYKKALKIQNIIERDEKRHKEYMKKLKRITKISKELEEEKNSSKTFEEEKKPLIKKKGRKTKSKYTPLEQQFIALKKKHPDILLFVEVGYKYKFFGKDAEIASKVLGILSFQSNNFLNASIPTVRLHVHLRRIVQAGYKAGLVQQTETAAIKAAGSNKSGPFTRELTAIYTKSTLVLDEYDDGIESSSCGHIVSIFEEKKSKNGKNNDQVKISLVAIDVSTGEILYDTFDDFFMRRELDTRIFRLNPSEILLPDKGVLSKETEKVIKNSIMKKKNEQVREERIEESEFNYDFSLSSLEEFFEFEKKQ